MKDISGAEHAHISCRNSRGKIAYVLDVLGHEKLSDLFTGILEPGSLVSNQYSYMGEPLNLDYFLEVNNWYSNEINLKLFANLSRLGVDAYHTGHYTITHAKETFNNATLAYLRMLSPKGIIERVNQVNSIYNRTKTIHVDFVSNDAAQLTLIYAQDCDHNHQVTRQNIGVYSAILEYSGFQVIESKAQELTEPSPRTQILFKWQVQSRWSRFLWLVGKICTQPFSAYMRSPDAIRTYHQDLIRSFEQEVVEKEKQRQRSEDYYQQLLQEQGQREAELNQLVEKKTNELKTLLHEKQRLFENISHELKTPLSLVLGPLELLAKEPLNTQQNQLLRQAQGNSERLLALVEQVLNLAEIKLVRQSAVKVNVNTQVNAIVASFSALLEQKQLSCRIDNQIDSPLVLNLFDQALETLLGNLLSNAIKYSDNGKHIAICLRRDHRYCFVEVQDENPAIGADLQAKLFERFTRGSSNETGHGLGLAIVKECCDEIGGNISVQSSNKGNSFTLKLPLAEDTEYEIDNKISNSEPSKAGINVNSGSHLLLVEDNQELADFLLQSLGREFDIHHCPDGAAALEYLNDENSKGVDLIVSDVMMPNISGLELCQQLKADLRYAHIPIILLSAKSDNRSRRAGIEAQADDYIGKPFSIELLLQKLRNWRNTYRAAQARTKATLLPNFRNNQSNGPEQEFLQRFQQTLAQLYSHSEIRSPQLAKHMGLSERQLSRRLQSQAGAGAAELLRSYRLEMAHKLLKEGASAKLACFDCGFNSMSHFSQLFKSQFGHPPSKVLEHDRQAVEALATQNE